MTRLHPPNLESPPSRKRPTLSVELEQELRQRIVGGLYQTHAYLPSERQLAKDFQTSRLTVAKALESLERDELVARTPGRGTRVLPAINKLTQPRISIVHGEFSGVQAASRHDSWKTLQGAREMFERLGYQYDLLAVSYPYDITTEQLLARCGAVLFIETCGGNPNIVAELAAKKVPVVIAKLEQVDLDVPATWVDHRATMKQTVQTLAMLGHTRIGFVGREVGYATHGKAREGYLEGLRDAGLATDESLIAECEKSDGLSGYFAARSLLKLENPPTAIAVARDSIAEGVCRAAEEAGLVLGRDISVIGFDDTTWPEGRKFLTTFREACREMGAAAAEMLIGQIVNGPSKPEKRRFDASFILRRTAGPYTGSQQVSAAHGADCPVV